MVYYHYLDYYTNEQGMIWFLIYLLWFLCWIITSFCWLFAKVLYLLYCVIHLAICSFYYQECQDCASEKQRLKHQIRQIEARRPWWGWG